MSNEAPNFEKHQGGMPSAAELKWRMRVVQEAFDARYYPFGREDAVTTGGDSPADDATPEMAKTPPAEGMPKTGTIDNFRGNPAGLVPADALLMRGMRWTTFQRPPR